MKNLRFVARRTLAVLLALLLAPSATSAQDLAPPYEPGPFNVGITTFSAVMSAGRETRIQVYYPTLDPPDEESRYTITTPAGSYQLRSLLCAVGNAQAAPGRFPLIVHDHGGGAAGADFQRVAQLPLHEVMASHGFVVAVARHSADPVTRIRDLPLVIDELLLFSFVDPDRIGISGNSAGGQAAVGAAGGWAANGIAADWRIMAMVLYEPGVDSLDDARTISVPYLIMSGTQSIASPVAPVLFDATVDATPRIYVQSPNATHLNYQTGVGSQIDQTREAALLADPDIPEPLTVRTATNAAAARAYDLWNQGEILFPALGFGIGSGRNFCDRVGVNSVRSLDNDEDGFTDSPPFLPGGLDPYTLQPAIPEEIMVPLIMNYTIAFWKKFLEGDDRYMRYLTPGYAERNELAAIVEIE